MEYQYSKKQLGLDGIVKVMEINLELEKFAGNPSEHPNTKQLFAPLKAVL